jgi:hypothetical protein
MAQGSRTLKLSILADVDDLKKGLTTAANDTDSFGTKLGDFGKKAGLAFAAAGSAVGVLAIKLGTDAIKAASDLSESTSKVGVIFGEQAKAIEDFASTAATSLGQTKQQVLDASATFATFGQAAGLTGERLTSFALNFTTLASDLASFNNTSPDQAINAIGAALRGESEPLRAYGVLLNDATLKSAALELKIYSGIGALTFEQKVLAAEKVIYEQTTAAQGDFTRTSDGLANSTRIMTAQLENAKTTIGAALLPVVLQITTFFSDKLIPIVEKLAFGFADEFTPAIENVKTFIQDSLIPIFISLYEYINKFIVPIFRVTLTPILQGVKSLFGAVGDAVSDNVGFFKLLGVGLTAFLVIAKPVAGFIGTTFKAAFNGIALIIDGVSLAIKVLIGTINGIITGLNLLISGYNIVNNLKPGSKDLEKIPKLAAGGMVKANSPYIVGEVGAELFVPSSSGRVIPNNQLGGGGNIYINVSGAIDQEGTARRIVDVLNNSFYRGTNGANALAF